jgi:uncharacterized membrane protein
MREGRTKDAPPSEVNGPVWSYRSHPLRPREFTKAMVHYCRAEVQGSIAWRLRLDNTTYWAEFISCSVPGSILVLRCLL